MKTIPYTKLILLSILASWAFSLSSQAESSSQVRQENFSLSKNHLALSGYDPVSYFIKGPEKGSSKISYTHDGITYHFANKDNLKKFKAAPAKYEPQYGGWCAWAMYDGGGRTKPDPKSYTITDGKLYVFYNGLFANTLKFWKDAARESSEDALIAEADRYWKSQINE